MNEADPAHGDCSFSSGIEKEPNENALSSDAILSSESAESSSLETLLSSSSDLAIVYGKMTDERDGKIYKTAYIKKLGQTWMAQNLNYAYLQPLADADSSSWCYENESDCCELNGRLYSWSAAMDSAAVFGEDGKDCGNYRDTCPAEEFVRGVCPAGWHLPNSEEWKIFLSFIWQGIFNASAVLSKYSNVFLQKKQYSFMVWQQLDVPNDYSFDFELNAFDAYQSYFWTSDQYNRYYAIAIEFASSGDKSIHFCGKSKYERLNIRCLKDE